MPRTTEVIGFSVPPLIARQVERLAKAEHITKSELFRDMVRVYKQYREQREKFDETWAIRLIQEAQKEDRRNPMPPEQLKKEDVDFRRSAAAQATELGIKDKDIDRIIHERRKERRHARRS